MYNSASSNRQRPANENGREGTSKDWISLLQDGKVGALGMILAFRLLIQRYMMQEASNWNKGGRMGWKNGKDNNHATKASF